MSKQTTPRRASRRAAPRGSASVYVQHERWMADRWKVMFRVGTVRFAIGAECDSRECADRLRADFEAALTALGITLPNPKCTGPEGNNAP